jgi:hypothetical protein
MRNTLKMTFSVDRLTRFVIALACLQAAAIGATAGLPGRGFASPSLREQAITDSGFAIVKGLVIDSLTGGYLSGAIVAVSGTPRMAITDSLGRFRIDGIAPGTRRIDVYHAALDELGMALVTPQMELRPHDSVALELAFPSATSIVRTLCRSTDRAVGPAAVLGQVLDAESLAPIAGARVTVEWLEYVVNKKKVGTSLEHRDATTAPDGHFRICGLPAEFIATLSASFGGDTTAKIAVRFDPIMAATTLRLAPSYTKANDVTVPAPGPPATAGAQRTGGSLTGRVIDPKGGAVAGARVAVDRPGTVAITTADGRFALHGIRPGTRSLYVRRIGFEPVEVPVDVSPDVPRNLTVQLADFVPVLDTVVVTAMLRDIGLERVGFAQRRKTGMGRYLGPEEIERRHAFQFVDLFTTFPMLRRSTYADGRQVLVGRSTGLGNGCVNYFVDDIPWFGGGAEDFIMPAEVGAIEVYSAAFTPGQYRRGGTPCETVIVWTKHKLRFF